MKTNVIDWRSVKENPGDGNEIVYLTKSGELKTGTYYEIEEFKKVGEDPWYNVFTWGMISMPTEDELKRIKKQNTSI